jgi:hypothetical protein
MEKRKFLFREALMKADGSFYLIIQYGEAMPD